MLIIHNPITPLALHKKLAIAIGTYDGFHRGHAEVVRTLLAAAKERDCHPALLTYDNHPSLVLNPEKPTPSICTQSHKFALLQKTDVEYLLIFTFDRFFASQTAEQFLTKLMQISPFSYINMGYDGRIGHNRSGDKEHLAVLSKRLGFDVEYMPSLQYHGEVVSSTSIRNYISKGELDRASTLLGRPYSIVAHVAKGDGRGAALGFPTANILVKGLITPPLGVWAVQVHYNGQKFNAVANLGHAPTLHATREAILEVHIPHFTEDLYGKLIEVVFFGYLRPEKRFESIDALKYQLALDVDDSINLLIGHGV